LTGQGKAMLEAGLRSLPEFPPCSASRLGQPASLLERGFHLRAARSDDLPFLRALYASTREEELALVPWPEPMRVAFIDQQFAMQHRHYVAHYPDADFLLIERGSTPIGRFYLQCGAPVALVIDISLQPRYRGMGVGSDLLTHTQAIARAQSLDVELHVLHANLAARRLYQRLGFVETADEGSHLRMRWSASTPESAQLNIA